MISAGGIALKYDAVLANALCQCAAVHACGIGAKLFSVD